MSHETIGLLRYEHGLSVVSDCLPCIELCSQLTVNYNYLEIHHGGLATVPMRSLELISLGSEIEACRKAKRSTYN